MADQWYYLKLNPEPWAIGPVGVHKAKSKTRGYVAPNLQLQAYQAAVKEELADAEKLPPGEYCLTFYFWRELAVYSQALNGRKIRKHQVDATNLQKGLEDALQGTLFDNDREVRDIRSVIVEQGNEVIPHIVIRASIFQGFNPDELPPTMWNMIDDEPVLFAEPESEGWKVPEEWF